MHTYLKFFTLIQLIFSFFFLTPCFATTAESYDTPGNLTITHYNPDEHLQSIESYTKAHDGALKLSCIERFEWHPFFTKSLIERSLEDHEGNLLISQTFDYNAQGQLIEEHLYNYHEAPFYTLHSYSYHEDGSRTRTVTTENSDPLALCICSRASADNSGQPVLSCYPTFEYSIHEERESFSSLSDIRTFFPEISIYEGQEAGDKVRISFINGMLNTKSDILKTVEWLCDIHGGNTIHYVFKPSEGLAWDVLKSSLVKLGIISPEATALAELWKQLIVEMGGTESGGTIIHYAHSIGGSNTYLAKSLMTPQELKMIQVYTFGSPTIIPPNDFQCVLNYVSVQDGVTFMDFIERLKALFFDDQHIVCVGTCWGNPEHVIQSESYRIPFENYGKAFVEQWRNMSLEDESGS